MKTYISKRYSIEQCRTNPTTCFVFGDNLERIGSGGQATIREEKNSIGLATKKAPSNREEDFFVDDEYPENCAVIDREIEKIKTYLEEMEFDSITFPLGGLGTGLSQMQKKCPKTLCYLTVRLLDEWQYNNLEFLASPLV